jgi:predicted DNA-binding transcriptional regulator AlpA
MSDIQELAKMTGCTESRVYYLARKLGRLPTMKEVLAVKRGRRTGSPVHDLAEKTGRSRQTIYNLSWKLGRLPTEEEVLSIKQGRKPKYTK